MSSLCPKMTSKVLPRASCVEGLRLQQRSIGSSNSFLECDKTARTIEYLSPLDAAVEVSIGLQSRLPLAPVMSCQLHRQSPMHTPPNQQRPSHHTKNATM